MRNIIDALNDHKGCWPLLVVPLVVVVVVVVGGRVLFRFFVHADCGWDASIQTWVDENGNGVWDLEEPPLENVQIYIDGSLDGQANKDRPQSRSDWNGRARISVFLAGCPPDVQFEIYTEPPPGYQLVTEAYIQVQDAYEENGQTFSFGFAREPGFPTPTPYVPGLTCKTYEQEAKEIVAAPDGSVWALFRDGIAWYDPVRDSWQEFEISAGSVGNHVALGDDNVIWVHGYGGATRFQDFTWTHYEGADRLAGSVPSFGTTPNGDVWFVNVSRSNRLASFNPETDSWKLYCGGYDIFCQEDVPVRAATDGSIWLAAFDKRAELELDVQDDTINWISFRPHTISKDTIDSMPIPKGDIVDAEIAPDGTIWVAYTFGLVHLDPVTEKWQVYESNPTSRALYEWPNDLAVAPDGSIWIASGSLHPLAFQLVPASDANPKDIWRTYDPRDGIPDVGQIDSVAVAADGSIWFGFDYDDVMARCIPIDQPEWVHEFMPNVLAE